MASTVPSLPLSGGKHAAVIMTGVIGTISTLSVALLLLHLFSVSFVSNRVNANKDERIFLRMHLGAFVVCLLLSDFVQGISGMFQLVWASHRAVTMNKLCTAQASMLLFGDTGTAFWNAVVAIHTFWTVVLGKRMSTVAVALIIATGWTFCLILTVIGPLAIQTPERGPFFTIAGAWCFIQNEYSKERIYLHYVPMFISAFIITVLYLLVALVLFGILIVDGTKWRFRAPPRRKGNGIRDFFGQFSWGRLGLRPSANTNTLSHSVSSGGTRSLGVPGVGRGRGTNSIRLASVPHRSTNDLHDPISSVNGVAVQSIDLTSARPATGSTAHTRDDSMDHERGRPSTAKKISLQQTDKREQKQQAAQAATQMSVGPNQPNGRSLQLKTLAIKMLWYPVVYLILILPIAISRVDSRVKVSLDVMLGFLCLLWLMGTANTIIYVCTRRLGPTPWARRNTMSFSRTRSKSGGVGGGRVERFDATGTSRSVAPVQILVNQYTHHATDEQLVNITREKATSSIGSAYTGPDVPIVAMTKNASAFGGRERIPSDSKVGFDLEDNRQSTPYHLPPTTEIRFEEPAPILSRTRRPLISTASLSHSNAQTQSRRHEVAGSYYLDDDQDSLYAPSQLRRYSSTGPRAY
ncbi:hypothetical protein PIIN_09151 [Serendipita indica DSM 11827]|uniref:G-protein coupled receptors family 2 profile 2 domain-containing protein n=1 Tax=Serendipita indica (strain DSM 11827) TaxID=1109443 RepID=G4TV24_SERID|nr:hypothetical protein PIIN_09151 [Serendipita indica DSM 11827]